MFESTDDQSVFTLLCHPINLAINNVAWIDPLEQFLIPALDLLGELNQTKKAWVCTCAQMTAFLEKSAIE